jgi:hypothetical protein
VVVTKDTDFVDTFLLVHRPRKLLLISTGIYSERRPGTPLHGSVVDNRDGVRILRIP